MLTDLASLLGDSPESLFINAFVKKERLVVKAKDAMRAEPLLPVWMLERILVSEHLPAARLTLLREGDVVPAASYRTREGRVRKDMMDALIAEGVSYVIADVSEDVPDIARLTDALARRLGHSVFVNAYVTHGPGGALAPHYDDHDVLVLQVHGKKRWFSHGSPTHAPIERSPDGVDFGPSQWDTLVEPGDALYLPRGEVHHTEVVGNLAVHLTFGIDTKRGVDFGESIIAGLRQDPLFREDLTRLGGEDALRAKEHALKARLHAAIDAADVSAFVAADEATRTKK
jgi:hypothetical protein